MGARTRSLYLVPGLPLPQAFNVDAPAHPYGKYSGVVNFPADGTPGEVYEELFSSATQCGACYAAGSTIAVLLLVSLLFSICRCDATKHRRNGPVQDGNTKGARTIAVLVSMVTTGLAVSVLIAFRNDCFKPSLDDAAVQADYGPAFFAVGVMAVLEAVQLFLHASIPHSAPVH